MKRFPLNLTRLHALDTRWRTAFTSLRTVIPPGLAIIHLATVSDGNQNPPVYDAQTRPTGLMQVPQRTGKRLGFREEDLKKTPNNIYAWARMTNQDAQSLYSLNKTLWTKPTYDFWLTVHLMFLMGTSFSTLWAYTNPNATHTNHVFTALLQWAAAMEKTDHVGRFNYREMQALVQHGGRAWRFLITLDGPDHATAAFGAEMSVPSRGSTMTVLQTSAT